MNEDYSNNNQTAEPVAADPSVANAANFATPPAQTPNLPFTPKKNVNDVVKAGQVRLIAILLICILVVNVAILVMQFIPDRIGAGNRNFAINGTPPTGQEFPGGTSN